MYTKTLLIFLCFSFISYSQQKLLVEYEFISNINGVSASRDATLESDGKSSLYTVYGKVPESESNVKQENVDENELSYSVTINTSKGRNVFVYNEPRKKILLHTSNINGTDYIIKEDTPSLVWDIIDEQKKMNSFNCNKAILHFRGREYTAWFTPEIPSLFGPWKFCGLPGLILEIFDKNGTYLWRAKKVALNYSPKDPITPPSLPNNAKKVSLREYVDISKENSNRMKSKLMSRLPEGVKIRNNEIDIKRNSIELIYEWEE